MFQGDQGYCYIPYDYLTNTDYCFDAWTIRKLATDDFGQDNWDNDDSVNYQYANNDYDNDNDDDDHWIENNDEDDYDNQGNYGY
jgi:hypothetical protein